ncbi:MAG: trehalose 6-phosphate phosphorylase, partial [Deltaproteobacteria bacterium]|nr:trehalose 6-phosphate phosphorylase [Deltaproteobacteria bacterium]
VLPHDRRRELCEELALGDDEIAQWDAISHKMRLVFLEDGMLAQFEGYDQLIELDWDGYRARYGDIHRLDLILESESDSPNRYKLSKQADVLMLFFLFSAEELRALFERLSYPFDSAAIPRTIDYYLHRTSDGSTLSRVAHAWVLARSARPLSWEVFQEALVSDVADIQHGTTREGIHLGAMAGSVDLLQRCYTGLELREGVLWINPRLPIGVRRLSLLVRYRAHTLELAISPHDVEVSVARCETPSIKIGLRDVIHELREGERRSFALS